LLLQRLLLLMSHGHMHAMMNEQADACRLDSSRWREVRRLNVGVRLECIVAGGRVMVAGKSLRSSGRMQRSTVTHGCCSVEHIRHARRERRRVGVSDL